MQPCGVRRLNAHGAPVHSERWSSSYLRRIESPVAFIMLSVAPKRADLDLDYGPKVEIVPGAVCRRRNRRRRMIDLTIINASVGLRSQAGKGRKTCTGK